MSDPNDNNTHNEPKTSRPHPKGGYEPTKSLLADPAWKERIKKTMVNNPLKHQEQLGSFFRVNAPFRAKLAPPFEKGKVLIIRGRVWSSQEKKGVPATMDVWHANSLGQYDNEESSPDDFINRARVRCDDAGYFEFETIHPGGYSRNEEWRASHIHIRVLFPGHVPCVQQIYFEGDEYFDVDPFVKDSLVIRLTDKDRNGTSYNEGELEIVLAPKSQNART
jgi:catechol 1,2-dioxygenase